MGGSNIQTQNKTENETYAQLAKQGMSGMGDESPEHYAKMLKTFYGDLKEQAVKMVSPNLFGRDISAPASQQNTNTKSTPVGSSGIRG